MKLTKAQKRLLLEPHREKIKNNAISMSMSGHGITDIVKKVSDFLGPIVKTVGPTVLKEFIVPYIQKKMAGNGMSPAGNGLKLAGQGKLEKGSPEAIAYMACHNASL